MNISEMTIRRSISALIEVRRKIMDTRTYTAKERIELSNKFFGYSDAIKELESALAEIEKVGGEK